MAKRFALTLTHPPNVCPSGNKASREASIKWWKALPELTKRYNLKMLSFDHFDPEHLMIAIFEAESLESVRDFAMQTGIIAWNDVKIHALTPVSALMDNIDQAPPTIF